MKSRIDDHSPGQEGFSLPRTPRERGNVLHPGGGRLGSQAPLRYLAVSTMELPELVEYPDSGKLGITAGSFGGRPPATDSIRHFAKLKDGVDYWEGED